MKRAEQTGPRHQDFDPPEVTADDIEDSCTAAQDLNAITAKGMAAALRKQGLHAFVDRVAVAAVDNPSAFLDYYVAVPRKQAICAAILLRLKRERTSLGAWLASAPPKRRALARRALVEMALNLGGWVFDKHPHAAIGWLQQKLELESPAYFSFLKQSEGAYYRGRRRDAFWALIVAIVCGAGGLLGGALVWGTGSWQAVVGYGLAALFAGYAGIALLNSAREKHIYPSLRLTAVEDSEDPGR